MPKKPDQFTHSKDTKLTYRTVVGVQDSEDTDELILTNSATVTWDTAQKGKAIATAITTNPPPSSAPGGMLDIHSGFEIFDTFLHGYTIAALSANSDVVGGDTLWTFKEIVGGGTFQVVGPEIPIPIEQANRMGIAALKAGTSATDDVVLFKGGDEVLASGGVLNTGDGEVIWEWAINLPDLSVLDNRYTFQCGAIVSVGGAINSGTRVIYRDNVNGGNWRFDQFDGPASSTVTDSGLLVAADTWYNIRAVIAADLADVKWYIDGVLRATVTTNVPGKGGDVTRRHQNPSIRISKQSGAAARDVYIDYFYGKKLFTHRLPG